MNSDNTRAQRETNKKDKRLSLMRRHHQRVLPGSDDGCGAHPIPATGNALSISTAISAFYLQHLKG